ncbi:MAG: HAD-IB family hydrolase [Alphaproteobacteria bacterium]|nr:HAD-IB family hydrolase [Alphaproteobacteria bacterium]MBU1513578.1 HAD-IB family hydrolase [Alphaproteobacteria bacterium]MBU2094777.1 HAD-IB family hydrolase [Alphaproteobacteria bacterium]MBU2150154.1 HAD-IB family hydrolase [Alphaproteobacteria bacterium]MBU2309317.1 HAD-IB family hydrolase [Alphaproteobacteria bacterium]
MAQEREADGPEPPVVAFDFDGTLTVKDSYTAFLKWRTPKGAWIVGGLTLIPAALAYLIHRDRGRIKAAATKVYLGGVSRERLEADARTFAEQHSRSLLRPDAVIAWKRWRKERVRLVIVTASPDLVVAPFARGLGADDLIGTPLHFDERDRATGAFAAPNCRGPEKVVRLQAAYGPALRVRAAYGDTTGDTEMLGIAEEPYLRVFSGRP